VAYSFVFEIANFLQRQTVTCIRNTQPFHYSKTMLNNLKYHISETISGDDKAAVLKILRDYTATIIDTSSGKHRRKDLNIVIKDS
jgi:hypothetical protein